MDKVADEQNQNSTDTYCFTYACIRCGEWYTHPVLIIANQLGDVKDSLQRSGYCCIGRSVIGMRSFHECSDHEFGLSRLTGYVKL